MEKHKSTNLIYIIFDTHIRPEEISLFRGAIIKSMEGNPDILFHNHMDKEFRYAYPLVQYKRIHQKAAIICIDEGIDSVRKFLATTDFKFRLGKKTVQMVIENLETVQVAIKIQPTLIRYNIKNWLPLSQSSYKKYKLMTSLLEQVAFLERILIGNILSFAKGIHIFFDKRIACHITAIHNQGPSHYKNTQLISFDIEFDCNVLLPDLIGIGKGSSIGNGVIFKKEKT